MLFLLEHDLCKVSGMSIENKHMKCIIDLTNMCVWEIYRTCINELHNCNKNK